MRTKRDTCWMTETAILTLIGCALALMNGCGCAKTAPRRENVSGPEPRETVKAGQFLAFLVDATGFADDWWDDSLDTADLFLSELARPKDVVCLMTIDDDSYEARNVLLGPQPLPGSTLRTHTRVREMRDRMKELKASRKPDAARRQPGTDMTGALHMLADYLEKQPDAWLNLFVFSDLVEERNSQSYTSAPQLPPNTRVVCLYVDRGESEAEWLRRKAWWTEEMGRYGVPASQVSFFDPRESHMDNFPTALLKEYRKPPSNSGGVAGLPVAGDPTAMSPSPAEPERTMASARLQPCSLY